MNGLIRGTFVSALEVKWVTNRNGAVAVVVPLLQNSLSNHICFVPPIFGVREWEPGKDGTSVLQSFGWGNPPFHIYLP